MKHKIDELKYEWLDRYMLKNGLLPSNITSHDIKLLDEQVDWFISKFKEHNDSLILQIEGRKIDTMKEMFKVITVEEELDPYLAKVTGYNMGLSEVVDLIKGE